MVEAALICLAQAIYFEARDQSRDGQYAVADVVLNRVESEEFPNTVCGVVRQDLGPLDTDCQFSYMCDGVPEHMHEKEAKQEAYEIAADALTGVRGITEGAEYYLRHDVRPKWVRGLAPVAVIGDHVFYREKGE